MMTERLGEKRVSRRWMLRAMGAGVDVNGNRVTIRPGGTLRPLDMTIPADISSAAFVLVAALLMPMPAYFVNWGRYTQLAAQALLPVVLWLLLEALEPPTAGPRTWLLAGLAAGTGTVFVA